MISKKKKHPVELFIYTLVMRSGRLLFSSFARASCLAAAIGATLFHHRKYVWLADTKESYSGIEFKDMLEVNSDEKVYLLGVGCRTKYYYVSIYAYGLYVGPSAAINASNDELLSNLVAARDATKAVQLTFCRNITGELMAEAFNESLGSRMQKRNDWQQQGQTQLQEFASQFQGVSLNQGSQLIFVITYGSDNAASIETQLEGKSLGKVKGEALTWALLDVYLGKEPVSNDIQPYILDQGRKKWTTLTAAHQ